MAHHTTRTILIALACLALSAANAAAQTLSASVSRDRVYVGDELLYNIVITDARTNARPQIEFPPSIAAEYTGQSQNSYTTTRRVGGQTQRISVSNITHQYRITPLSPGVNTIPAATLQLAGGDTLTSNAVRFEAILPEPALDAPITLTTPRTTLYAGETTEVTITWTMPESVRRANFDTSEFPASLNPAPVETSSTRTGRTADFEFRGQRAVGVIEPVFTPNGQQLNQFRFTIRINPTQTGTVTLGPARVVFNRPRSVDGWARSYSESDPITLTILPVPTDNQPDNFSGLIGTYNLRALANPTSANVGDPITLRVELIGKEPLPARNPLPDLEDLASFDNLFRLSPEGWTEQTPRQAGKRVYTTTIRALTDEATAIPPIEISTFDPESATYQPVRSDPIQLDIRAVREATIADAIVTPGLGTATNPADNRRTLSPADPAFWAPPTVAQIESARPFALTEQLRRPAVIAAIASGPAILLSAYATLLVTRRRADPARVRDRRLRDAEHAALRRSPPDAVRAAAAVALDCNPASVTLADLERLPAHPGIIKTLQAALAPAEFESTNTEPVSPKDTRLAIRALRNELRRRPSDTEPRR